MPIPIFARAFAVALAVATFLTACGSDDDSSPPSSGPGTEQPPTTPSKPDLRCAP